MEDKIKTVLFKVIDSRLNGVDIYYHGNILWVIFSKRKEWVFRLDKEGNLVYSYYFFKKIFQWLSMDVIEKQEYITEYVENAILNGIRHTSLLCEHRGSSVENVIQNGITYTQLLLQVTHQSVENVIQNEVRNTQFFSQEFSIAVENVVQNGIRNTFNAKHHSISLVESTIQNGVKETSPDSLPRRWIVEKALQNGTNLKK